MIVCSYGIVISLIGSDPTVVATSHLDFSNKAKYERAFLTISRMSSSNRGPSKVAEEGAPRLSRFARAGGKPLLAFVLFALFDNALHFFCAVLSCIG